MADWRDAFIKTLKGFKGLIKRDEPLAPYTTLGIGGPCDIFAVPEDMEDLRALLKDIRDLKIPFFVIGGGSNLLISDKGFRGVVISLGKGFDRIEVKGQRVEVGGATRLSKLVNLLISSSLSGAEFLWWIPGTFGGAVKCNAGAFSSSMGDIVEEVEGIDLNGRIRGLKREEIGFRYRGTDIRDDFIITGGVLLLKKERDEEIRRRLREVIEYRKRTQPLDKLSAGCIFRNPKSQSAGRIIDELGLKGLSIGDAYISEKHANFIINRGKASFKDIVSLIKEIKRIVKEKRGIELKEEVIIIGGNYAKAG